MNERCIHWVGDGLIKMYDVYTIGLSSGLVHTYTGMCAGMYIRHMLILLLSSL